MEEYSIFEEDELEEVRRKKQGETERWRGRGKSTEWKSKEGELLRLVSGKKIQCLQRLPRWHVHDCIHH